MIGVVHHLGLQNRYWERKTRLFSFSPLLPMQLQTNMIEPHPTCHQIPTPKIGSMRLVPTHFYVLALLLLPWLPLPYSITLHYNSSPHFIYFFQHYPFSPCPTSVHSQLFLLPFSQFFYFTTPHFPYFPFRDESTMDVWTYDRTYKGLCLVLQTLKMKKSLFLQ